MRLPLLTAKLRTALAAVSCGAVLSIASAAPAHAAAGTWHPVPLLLWPIAQISDVAPESADSVWVAGFQGRYCIQWIDTCALQSMGQPVVRRRSGSAWKEYPIHGWTGQGRIERISSGAGETWIAGADGTAETTFLARFDGTAFQPVTPPPGVAIVRVETGSAGTWVEMRTGTGYTLYRRTGDTWTPVDRPATLRFIAGLKSRAANDAWAVGDRPQGPNFEQAPAIAHWNGAAWENMPIPTEAPASQEPFNGVAPVSADAVWAITSTSLDRWNGNSWTVVPAPSGIRRLNNLAVDGTGTPWVVAWSDLPNGATSTSLYRYTGGKWEKVLVPAMDTLITIEAVPGTDALWGVGTVGALGSVVTNS